MGLIKSIKKGVKAGYMAIAESNQELNDTRVLYLINEFNRSNKRRVMETGERYYRGENDIQQRRAKEGKANNKLAHAKYKGMVDEKVSYLLTRDITLKCADGDQTHVERVRDVLGKRFQYQLSLLGYEASNKGIAWLQPYIDRDGRFKTMVIPSEQCIPVWRDSAHEELDIMIRVYPTMVWEFNQRKSVTNVEVWTAEGVSHYRLSGTSLLIPYSMDGVNGPVAHYQKGDEWRAWGRVPFVPFKNNHLELPDIAFVKSLLDAYDGSRSDAADYVEEVKNLVYVLYGYSGEDIRDFMRQLNEDRAIPLDSKKDDGSGVEALTPSMDITALREHYEQLKRDITEDGQTINKDLDKFGSAPSGVALKFMYAGLDLKANAMETQFKFGFEQLMYFAGIYLGETGVGGTGIPDIDIVFNRDMQINEAEKIDNCTKSKGTISDETILANHPWVKDVEAEKTALEQQKREELPDWDQVGEPDETQ